ncbi:PAS domain S-box [Halobacteroides halobius DSM 5150]|uniref:PAS domain S-box n=1 Tax=Halobacteroides halobius (strain ATCC 35273 / DSM 5150 / MD-1) TaxID=748449 RepID=L0K770_HALHC|nr:sigma-54-dependent Fis family transcriptional regulator [Halobacteroides halobius]AGB41132.1 PAS domain S-box [Halobacteroides halobius DSM 5150]
MKRLSDQVIKENNLFVTTMVGDLKEGVKVANRAINKGAEVIISRGGTASLIKQNISAPVVEINVTGYDLLRVLYKYRQHQEQIGVIGYENVIYGVKAISELIGINIDYYKIEEESQVESRVEEAVNNNVKTIIGDTITVRTAKGYNLNYELITSGKEAILNSIYRAQKVYEATVVEREKKEKLETILDSAHEGIIAIDKEGVITAFNPKAENLFNKQAAEVIDNKVDQIIPSTKLLEVLKEKQPKVGEIQNVGQTKIATNRVPIKVGGVVKGAVATFQDVTKVQELEQKIRQELNKKGLTAQYKLEDIIGVSKEIQDKKRLAYRYGQVDSTVLINGESGTGKELFAQGIHNCSQRKVGPFVAINCAALPTNLLESELFGYEEGSFTGAQKGGKKGLFELAHQGTIFLDEIAEMDQSLQARLLRVIQEKEVMKLGGREIIPIDVRIIAATNKNLKEEIEAGRFRKDLYYRLNVLDLTIPPLRKRREDIQAILDFLIVKKSGELNKQIIRVDKEVIKTLVEYDWPGNVRELENIIEKMIVTSKGKVIEKEEVDFILAKLVKKEDDFKTFQCTINATGTLEEMEKEIIKQVVTEVGSKTQAANKLGITRSTIWRKLKE